MEDIFKDVRERAVKEGMLEEAQKQTKIATKSVKITLIALAITVALSSLPLSLSIINNLEIKYYLERFLIFVYLGFAVFVIFLAKKIQVPK